MPVELEAKIKVDSHEAVRARLAELGGQCVARLLELNLIFDRADRTLLASGCGLRIRVCVAESGDAPPPTMTFKGPRQPGPLKKREEVEISFDEADQGRTLLERLGFVEAVRFEKRRESWQLEECQVELDEVPHLGGYVEIEGPDEHAVRQVQELLGLAGEKVIRQSYVSLLIKYCQRHGLPTNAVLFPSGTPA